MPKPDYTILLESLHISLANLKLQPTPWFIEKIIQVSTNSCLSLNTLKHQHYTHTERASSHTFSLNHHHDAVRSKPQLCHFNSHFLSSAVFFNLETLLILQDHSIKFFATCTAINTQRSRDLHYNSSRLIKHALTPTCRFMR